MVTKEQLEALAGEARREEPRSVGRSDSPALSLAALEAFDPRAPQKQGERDFCCPLPGPCEGKPIDAAHRSLSANIQTGLWECHRCGARGKLTEWWDERPAPRRLYTRSALRRVFEVPPLREDGPQPEDKPWRHRLRNLEALAGTRGAAYLEMRGISADLAHRAGVRYSPDWFGRPAIVFPLRSRSGRLVAAHGRHADDRTDPKGHDAGPKSRGCFATPGAWDADPIVLTEGPINALSLAACGFPAAATMGTHLPDFLPRACAFRRVLIATDGDPAGDEAAERWEVALRSLGARPERLRPEQPREWYADWIRTRVFSAAELLAQDDAELELEPSPAAGDKADWNDLLRTNAAGLRAILRAVVGGPPAAEPTPAADLAALVESVGKRLQWLDRCPEGLSDEEWPAWRDRVIADMREMDSELRRCGQTIQEFGWCYTASGLWHRATELPPEPPRSFAGELPPEETS